MAEDYVYAVARIRAKELSLLSRSDIESLLSAKDYEDAMQELSDKGYGDSKSFSSPDELLSFESAKTWSLVSELTSGDLSSFAVLRYPIDFHNLKAAIKTAVRGGDGEGVFVAAGTIDPKELLEAAVNSDFDALPEHLKEAAAEASDALVKTSDGQLCDIIIDKKALEAILLAGRKSHNEMIEEYAQLYVALADIKIAVRCSKTGKTLDFIKAAVADCPALDTERLIDSAVSGIDKLYEYILTTEYSDAVPALRESLSAYEKWSDNRIMELIRAQKANAFTVAPIVAYILARENEIKAIRIVLYAKQSGLSESSVRERLRDMYV